MKSYKITSYQGTLPVAMKPCRKCKKPTTVADEYCLTCYLWMAEEYAKSITKPILCK